MKFISDPAQRRQITKLMATYVEAGAAIVQARANVEELYARREELQKRARSEAPSPPAGHLGISDASITALAADANANIDDAEIAAATAAQDQARTLSRAQRARVCAINAAITKLDDAIAAAENAVPDFERAEKSARVELLESMHAALVSEFKARWAALASEVIDPMIALGFDPDINSGTRDHITTDSLIRFYTWHYHPERGGVGVIDNLLLLDPLRVAERQAQAPALVDRLLAEIPSGGKVAEVRATFGRSRERMRSAWVAAIDAAGRTSISQSTTFRF